MNINNLKEVIRVKKKSQRELASDIGMTQSGLSQALASGDLKVSVLEKIANSLGVDVRIFFNDTESTPEIGTTEFERLKRLENENELLRKMIKDKEDLIELLKSK